MIALMSLILVGKAPVINQLGVNPLDFSQNEWSLPMVLGVFAVLGMIGLMFTSFRFVTGYFFAGMLYWLWVEGLHWIVAHLAPNLAVTDSYVLAVALSLLPLVGLLSYLPSQKDSHNTNYSNRELSPTSPHLRTMAGQRPFILEKDTDFYQHYIRHSSVTDK